MYDEKAAIILERHRCISANESLPDKDRRRCGEKFSADWTLNGKNLWTGSTLLFVLAPITVGWIVAYGVLAVVRRRANSQTR